MPASKRYRLGLAQINLEVGAVGPNVTRVLATAARARDDQGCDLVLFPELTLSGYPPEDLLFHGEMRRYVAAGLERIRSELTGIAVLVGYPEYDGDALYNAAVVYRDGEVLAQYRKHCLPNYAVFDEKRYFDAGSEPGVFTLGDDLVIGLNICEDVWEREPGLLARDAGAQLILAINGSPYELGYQRQREAVLRKRVAEHGVPIVYLNYVGGQDELVFDGGSLLMNAAGDVVMRAPAFDAGLFVAEAEVCRDGVRPVESTVAPYLEGTESVYRALITGTRDYVDKHGFAGVVLGLSGGIDSALTLAVAVDALGADRVQAVMMPSRYTSDMSIEDARQQTELLGVRHDVLPIEPIFRATREVLSDLFEGLPEDATEENIQARCRGMLLMAISNKTGRMLLTTGNKSEMAVGYATLYGDMAGGFAPIKDCSKTLVYQLARYRNAVSPVIPVRVLERSPSAELRAEQKDSDSLPPYEQLDPILEAFIEEDCSVDEVTARGFPREVVGRILSMVRRNEYKRRQAPPGIRISGRAFGRDWRYPITSGFNRAGES